MHKQLLAILFFAGLVLSAARTAQAEGSLQTSKFEKLKEMYHYVNEKVDWKSFPNTYYSGRCYNGTEYRNTAMGAVLAIDEYRSDDGSVEENEQQGKYFSSVVTRLYGETYFDDVTLDTIEKQLRADMIELNKPYGLEFKMGEVIFEGLSKADSQKKTLYRLKKSGDIFLLAAGAPPADEWQIGLVCTFYKKLL